jgi:two-component system nitrogen regulation sensor histidine kinase GlnL
MKPLTFTVDKNLRIRSWNEDLEAFTGADAASAVGQKYTRFFPPLLLHEKDAVAETMRQKKPLSLKRHSFQCLSHHRQATIMLSPVRKENGTAGDVKIVLRPSRPCEVGRQLIDAQKLIAIGKISATLAHGVRNPLNAIKGAVVYLRDRYANEKPLIEFTEILEAEISRLESFISRFLNTTTFDSDIAPVDINELIRKIKVFISLQTYTRNIRCEYRLEPVPLILISAFHLEQALLNVINNAIEAMPSGGMLSIRTFLTSAEPESLIEIEISDTGSGIEIPPESAFHAHQLSRHGRGFGLFIADEIIKCYGGHLKMRGEHGKGTTVAFLLPTEQPKGE